MVGRSLKDFLVGALVGIMSMMPGASGGIIAVVFGIYERLIADLADIRGRLFKDLRFIIPVGIGIVVGLLVCAVGIDALLQNWEVPMMFFFAALILYQMPDIRDMALIYQGGSHRLDWTVEEFRPYVVHEFADGERDWLFDGFLFLEFKNGSGRNYTVGYEKLNARRGEWEWLLGRIFEPGKSLSALDQCIGEEIARLGKPGFTHRIVLGLPEAIRGQKDWGELDGRTMDFSDEKDQIAATRWYIDQLIDEALETVRQTVRTENVEKDAAVKAAVKTIAEEVTKEV